MQENGGREGEGWSSSPELMAQEVYSLGGGSQKGDICEVAGNACCLGASVWS